MEDFIGFTYNGKHCIKDFDVYRTSDGSRYNDNLVPSTTDKTADVPGGDGQYFFKTTHKNRQFSVSIAFDHLTEQKYREMRTWLDGKEIHDLIFDEAPYKVYSAKVTGTPQLKTICFDEEGQRIYKGEGTIQFTCYYPYAHTPNDSLTGADRRCKRYIANEIIKTGILIRPNQIFCSRQNVPIQTICYCLINNQWTKEIKITIDQEQFFTIDSLKKIDGFIYKNFDIEAVYIEDLWMNQNIDEFMVEVYSYLNAEKTRIEFRTYVYTDKDCFESYQIFYGKDINSYCLSDYPNKKEWIITFGQGYSTSNCENFGDLPASFIVTGEITGSETTDMNMKVGDCEITIKAPFGDFDLYWNSKNGIVGKKEEDGKIIPIQYTGKSYGGIPVNKNASNTFSIPEGLTIEYNYWYY